VVSRPWTDGRRCEKIRRIAVSGLNRKGGQDVATFAENARARLRSRGRRRDGAVGCVSGSDAAGANLSDADLESATLTQADLAGANLSGADLIKAKLSGADLTGADVTGAIFTKVKWSATTCPDGTNSNNDGGTCVNNL
jgi:uncharacterized protein YjbI with pentapeptide repeats